MSRIKKMKKIADKIPDKLKWKLKFCLVAFIIVFVALQVATLFVSSAQGDPYLFPQGLLAKGDLENEPVFKDHISSHGYIIKDLSWFTAERHGSIWSFYLKVQIRSGYNEFTIEGQTNYWDYHTNGNVYYDTETHEVVFDLIGE